MNGKDLFDYTGFSNYLNNLFVVQTQQVEVSEKVSWLREEGEFVYIRKISSWVHLLKLKPVLHLWRGRWIRHRPWQGRSSVFLRSGSSLPTFQRSGWSKASCENPVVRLWNKTQAKWPKCKRLWGRESPSPCFFVFCHVWLLHRMLNWNEAFITSSRERFWIPFDLCYGVLLFYGLDKARKTFVCWTLYVQHLCQLKWSSLAEHWLSSHSQCWARS